MEVGGRRESGEKEGLWGCVGLSGSVLWMECLICFVGCVPYGSSTIVF